MDRRFSGAIKAVQGSWKSSHHGGEMMPPKPLDSSALSGTTQPFTSQYGDSVVPRRRARECVAGRWSAQVAAASESINARVLVRGVGIVGDFCGRVIARTKRLLSGSKISTKPSPRETAVVGRRRGVREAGRSRQHYQKATNCSVIEHQKADSPANFSALAPFLAEPLRYDT